MGGGEDVQKNVVDLRDEKNKTFYMTAVVVLRRPRTGCTDREGGGAATAAVEVTSAVEEGAADEGTYASRVCASLTSF